MHAPRRFISPLGWAVIALLLFLLPFALLRGQSYVTLDDNLDVELTIPYLLTRHHVVLDYRPTTVVEPIMNGLPRNALRPGLSVTMLLFGLLEPLPAYLVQQALVRLLGLLGLYALLRRHLLRDPTEQAVAAGLSLAWAVLPFYSIYGLTVLGQPWLLYAFLNLRHREGRWTDWLLIAAFPFWSMFVFVGPFVAVGLALLLLHDWLAYRRWSWPVVGGVGLLLALYLVVEYPLVYSLLVAKQFVPHRLEFNLGQLGPQGWGGALKSAAQYFFMGQYHASRFFRGIMLLALALALRSRHSLAPARRSTLLVLLAALAAVALFCGIYPRLLEPLQRAVPALGAFNLTRFHFLTALLGFILLALSLQVLRDTWVVIALVMMQILAGVGMNTEWLLNVRQLAGRPKPTEPNYQQFVAAPLFARVQDTIRLTTGQLPPAYRLACLGLPPAIAQLNGFYTLDSYQNNYPLAYKHAFRPLIAGELAKSPALRTYFDDWGNRCYLFSAELGKNFRVGAFQQRVVQDFAFDAQAFRRLGGRYVLAAARLAQPARAGLTPRGEFSARNAYWHLYLYEVQP